MCSQRYAVRLIFIYITEHVFYFKLVHGTYFTHTDIHTSYNTRVLGRKQNIYVCFLTFILDKLILANMKKCVNFPVDNVCSSVYIHIFNYLNVIKHEDTSYVHNNNVTSGKMYTLFRETFKIPRNLFTCAFHLRT